MSETTIPVREAAPPLVARQAKPRVVNRRQATQRSAADPAPPAAMHHDDRAAPARTDESEPITRRSREQRDVNRYAIPQRLIPPGWDVEWKTISVLGQAVSSADLMDIHEGGWRPEKAKNWSIFVPPGTDPDATIELDGMRLYGRPKSFTLEAKREDEQAANRQMRDRMMASQEGRVVKGGEGGLADMSNVVRAVPLGVSVEGEVGSTGERVLRR